MKLRMIGMILCVVCVCCMTVHAGDWPGFRGPDAKGVSDVTDLPVTFSDTENLVWKIPLPGAGSSSPIVVGNRVLVTCYSGYGLSKDEPGDPSALRRHLICVDASSGAILWDKSVAAVQPELPFKGMMCEHGYASHTPVSDGKNVYAFFGKNGVYAYDLDGTYLWDTPVGTGSDKTDWGSAASPVLAGDLVIVNAWDESKTLYALNKSDGKERWKKDLSQTAQSYAVPVLVKTASGQAELVVVQPTKVWGLDPETGKELWVVDTSMKDCVTGSPVVDGDIVYVHGGSVSSLSSMAIRVGGRGNVTDTHVLWSGKEGVSVPSPVIQDGLGYCVDNGGVAKCQDLKTGDMVYSEKLPAAGRFAVYGSMVLADSKLYATTRTGGIYTLAPGRTFEILGHSTFASDDSQFNGSPAISGSRLFIRSDKALYCVAKKDSGWISLFDGKTLNGWKPSENKGTFTVKDGMIVANGDRSHLFYEGPVANSDFRNFEWKAEIKTEPGSNSGMYFHTEYQETGWPDKGYEVQVNNSHSDWRRTGGLYAVEDVREAPAKDGEWFTQHIIVKDRQVTVKVNGKVVVDYTVPDEAIANGYEGMPGRKLSHGTLALQGHDPGSVVYYRTLQIKPLP